MSSTSGSRKRMSKALAAGGSRAKSARASMQRVPRLLTTRGTPNGVHQFKRTAALDFNVNNTGVIVGGGTSPGLAFQFCPTQIVIGSAAGTLASAAMPGYTELSALFDQIKIVKAIVRFRSRNDSSNIVSNSAIEIGTAVDYNDASPPTAIADIHQYGTFKSDVIQPGGKQHTRVVTPHWTELVYYTAVLSGYASKTGYIRSDYDIPHYGLKAWIVGSASVQLIQVEVEYLYECKNTK